MRSVRGACEQSLPRSTGKVYFSNDCVRAVVDSAGVYNAAQSPCWMRMVACPPRDFDVKISGSVSSPIIEVILPRTGALLQQLPLLSEIDSSTGSSRERQPDEEGIGNRTADFNLPCSVWGVVSLLLLLEGSASMIKPWFADLSADPGLVNQTLQV